MAKMPKEVMDLFNDPQASKVLATVNAEGTPNVTPKGSLTSIDEETIAFAELGESKTGANLEATKKGAVVVFKLPAAYQLKGTFQGFQTSGPLFDQFDKAMKERIKVGIKRVGTIKVEEVYSSAPADYGKKLV